MSAIISDVGDGWREQTRECGSRLQSRAVMVFLPSPARVFRLGRGEGREEKSYSHFGESAGTFAHIQFFHEPSPVTQADDVEGICAASAA